MTLEKTLLQKLAEWRTDKGRGTLTAETEAGMPTAALTADHNDALACKAWELALDRKAPVEDVQGWAERACTRVTGLLEPLRLIETDPAHKTAQLRSQAPAQRDGTLSYYEVMLSGTGQASVRRYHSARDGKRREQVPFVLTHEVLARLASDLLAAV